MKINIVKKGIGVVLSTLILTGCGPVYQQISVPNTTMSKDTSIQFLDNLPRGNPKDWTYCKYNKEGVVFWDEGDNYKTTEYRDVKYLKSVQIYNNQISLHWSTIRSNGKNTICSALQTSNTPENMNKARKALSALFKLKEK